MELKLAKELNAKTPKKAKLEDLFQEILDAKKDSAFLYFDKENNHKDLQKAKAFLESKGKAVFLNEVRYGLDPKDYIYSFHIISKVD